MISDFELLKIYQLEYTWQYITKCLPIRIYMAIDYYISTN